MSSTESNSTVTNQWIGRYEIKAKVGQGTSGVVYRARDPLMDRDVAIKLARTNVLSEEELERLIDEFKHEAMIAGKFAHENVVTIYDVVSEGRLNYIVMEFVAGRSVQGYMQATGALGLEEALAVIYKCCVGLAYVHYNGVIHRDIKPGNIMYHPANSVTKLMDFSVAHKIERPPARDNGTIAYMAPEHFDPERRISTLTDIFAMGSTMYHMLTNQYPFDRDRTALQILYQEPAPMTSFRDDLPQSVISIVHRAMAKSDGDRFPSAAVFARRVEQVMNELFPNTTLLRSSHRYMRL